MEYCLLADEPAAANTVAQWYYDQWCKASGRATFEAVFENVSASINREKPPLIVLCKHNNHIIGAAELKLREMAAYPEYEFWLGGVYVTQEYRGQGIAAQLVARIIEIAQGFGITYLHLQTEDLTGGLYRQFGFEHLHQVNSKGIEVTVMRAQI
ncbi:GNAT family N-acetyltransferase [Bacterioplanes sanyensis]|uniref:GNAT family N-acetyltransferase n=1 Tax=Bacterioplanes sanyensis TaxID=1249553 RepID=A0A222FKF7_9GAMM|nr:GNAT family N-acetyltransferase [Bacterioplanes sanyensis]ASP39515.1 GNAT family N-acetyltransferase [Bacterioplanes sanyensis]